MAITDGTAGSWVATTTRNPTVTLPAHSAGQMLLVRVGWKSDTPTTDVAVCNTSGWAKLGQFYNSGGASSNGGGGVLVALFWKVATSSSETNPVIEFDDATAPTPGCYSAVSYSKGASENWDTPLGDGGAIAAATSYSGTIQSHVSATSGDMLDAFAVTNDNTTLTVPTVSQAGLTLDTVTEYPATALSSGTSNDISADGRNRLATAGTSSAAAVVSGTNSVADPGAAWCTRLRVVASDTAPAELASGTGGAYDASVAVRPSADTASGTGAAYDATVTTGVAGDTAPAELSAGTGDAYNATAAAGASAGAASGTGAAHDASAAVRPRAELAAGTGAAYSPGAAIKPTAGTAAGAGAALDAKALVGGGAEAGAGTAAASDAMTAVAPTAGPAAATGAASDATTAVKTTAGGAAGTGIAYDAGVLAGSVGGAGLVAADAFDALAHLAVNADAAGAAGAAANASAAIRSIVGLAGVTVGAYDATVFTTTPGGSDTAPAGVASVAAQAYNATISTGGQPTPPGGGRPPMRRIEPILDIERDDEDVILAHFA